MRLVAPAPRERRSTDRLVGRGLYHCRPVSLVCVRLLGRNEPGTQPRTVRAEGQDCREPAPVRDAARGDDGDPIWRHVGDTRHERCRRHVALDVPTGLPALCHDYVDARLGRPVSLVGAPDGGEHVGSRFVDAFDVW